MCFDCIQRFRHLCFSFSRICSEIVLICFCMVQSLQRNCDFFLQIGFFLDDSVSARKLTPLTPSTPPSLVAHSEVRTGAVRRSPRPPGAGVCLQCERAAARCRGSCGGSGEQPRGRPALCRNEGTTGARGIHAASPTHGWPIAGPLLAVLTRRVTLAHLRAADRKGH